MTKIIISLVLAVVIGGAIYGAYQYPKQELNLGSVVGSTFNTAKIAATVYSPATSAASSTSVYNSDSSTRYVTSSFVSCVSTTQNGATFSAATTTVPNEGLQGSTNYVLNAAATTTATSQNFFVASSTEGVPTYVNRIWPSGTYLTFLTSAVVSGPCTIGVNYIPS